MYLFKRFIVDCNVFGPFYVGVLSFLLNWVKVILAKLGLITTKFDHLKVFDF